MRRAAATVVLALGWMGCTASAPPLGQCESPEGESPVVCESGVPLCDDDVSINTWCDLRHREELHCTDGDLPDCPDGGKVRCVTEKVCANRDPCDHEPVEVETETGDVPVDDGCD